MESAGATFADALAEAQALGYAEADPTDDVEGYDARASWRSSARSACGCELEPADIAVPVDPRRRRGGLPVRATARVHDPPDLAGRARSGRSDGVMPRCARRWCRAGRCWRARRQQEPDRGARPLRRRHGLLRLGCRRRTRPSVAVVSDLAAIARARSRSVRSPVRRSRRRASIRTFADRALPAVRRARPAGHHRGAGAILASHDINIDAVLQQRGHSKDACRLW